MRTEQVNLRLEEDILTDLQRVANEESLDRATVIRRLLKESIKRWQLDRALRGYERGELSIGRAAEESGLSQWELMDAIGRERVSYPMSGADVRERLRGLDALGGGRPGPGFQVEVKWMRSTVKTLADVPPRSGGILLAGINPAPVSVEAGHYYQGRLGKRLWARLARLGLLVDPIPGREDEAFIREGHGLTDLVKRPTQSGKEVGDEELRAGMDLLREHVRSWEPGWILFPFKRAASLILGDPSLRPGAGPPLEGVATFLLSGPYAPAAETERVDEEFASALKVRAGDGTKLRGIERRPPEPAKSGGGAVTEVSVLGLAAQRFGEEAVRLYMSSKRQSEAAKALGMDGLRLRNITRKHGTYVSRGDKWDRSAKLRTLIDIVSRSGTIQA